MVGQPMFNLTSPIALSHSHFSSQHNRSRGNGDLDLNTGLDVDNDLLDDLGGGVQVDESCLR